VHHEKESVFVQARQSCSKRVQLLLCLGVTWGSNDQRRMDHGTGTIYSPQGWSASHNDGGQWVPMNLGSAKWVDGIVTQGGANGYGQYVTRYVVLTSEDSYSFYSQGI
jgi:F5/8 type C domain